VPSRCTEIRLSLLTLSTYMQCSKCRLENPPSAETCDCGYSLKTGLFVAKRANHLNVKSERTHAQETRQYYALETISSGFRFTAWANAVVLVLLGFGVLMVNADPGWHLKVWLAIGFFGCAFTQWLILKGIAEGIMLFLDIADDVRKIADRH
jgi:hypothetical protein